MRRPSAGRIERASELAFARRRLLAGPVERGAAAAAQVDVAARAVDGEGRAVDQVEAHPALDRVLGDLEVVDRPPSLLAARVDRRDDGGGQVDAGRSPRHLELKV